MSKIRYLGGLMGLVSALAACGGSSGSDFTSGPPSPPPPPPPSLSTGPEVCTDGDAGEFSCSGVDLRSRLPISEMDGVGGNDIWGWFDSQTGREYALMGLRNGTAFVDISDPENPAFLGRLPTQTTSSTWRDIKVYQDHAFRSGEAPGRHGVAGMAAGYGVWRFRQCAQPGYQRGIGFRIRRRDEYLRGSAHYRPERSGQPAVRRLPRRRARHP
ncbi:MAG: choice-of-anchor B family protein [Gammaproteobacteria bacterium]|nr:choice-of-anchor B family protein [Gammaproteobacteria bacterium]